MNRVKTRLRSRINDERTSDLTLISFETELAKSVDCDAVITKFAQRKARRVPLI